MARMLYVAKQNSAAKRKSKTGDALLMAFIPNITPDDKTEVDLADINVRSAFLFEVD